MTLTPDRLDDLDFPTPELDDEPLIEAPNGTVVIDYEAPYNDGTLLRAIEPSPRPTMAEFLDAMDEMETEYRVYLHERAAMPNPAHSFYDDMVAARQRILEQPYEKAQRVIEEQRVRHAQERRDDLNRRIYQEPWGAYGGRDWYCYCSPTRGHYLNRMQRAQSEDFVAYQPPGVYADAQPGPMLAESEPWIPDTRELEQVRSDMASALIADANLSVNYHRWEGEMPNMTSKEIAVIQPSVF